MRLLVAGAGGFVGSNVAQAAIDRGHSVIALCHAENPRTRRLQSRGADVRFADFFDSVPAIEADACVYTAGSASHALSLTNPELDRRLNADAAVRFLQTVRCGVVLLSSAAVYHGHRGLVDPSAALRPTFPYAMSKQRSEQLAGSLLDQEAIDWLTVVRLYYAFGPGESERRLVPRMLSHLASNERPFLVTAPKDSLIDPLYVSDVARALVSAGEGAARGETLDLCGGNPRRVPEFVAHSLRLLGSDCGIEESPNPSELPLLHWSSPERSFRLLRIEPTPLEQGLRESLSLFDEARAP